mmetsp:Transcript_68163/g.156421  ORF Transcript_68163/g.156421 Transcript_68163/m.156421 type:complete len:487 (+) Transcript_68163:364-1824(+)
MCHAPQGQEGVGAQGKSVLVTGATGGIRTQHPTLRRPAVTVEFLLDRAGESDPRDVVHLPLRSCGLTKLLDGEESGVLEHFVRVSSCTLACNHLSSLRSIGMLSSLEHLNISFNAVTSLGGIQDCASLQELKATGNRIKTLAGVEQCDQLRLLHVDANHLEDLAACLGLLQGVQLIELNISGNPCTESDCSQHHVVSRVTSVGVLDGSAVTSLDRALASQYFQMLEEHRADAAAQRPRTAAPELSGHSFNPAPRASSGGLLRSARANKFDDMLLGRRQPSLAALAKQAVDLEQQLAAATDERALVQRELELAKQENPSETVLQERISQLKQELRNLPWVQDENTMLRRRMEELEKELEAATLPQEPVRETAWRELKWENHTLRSKVKSLEEHVAKLQCQEEGIVDSEEDAALAERPATADIGSLSRVTVHDLPADHADIVELLRSNEARLASAFADLRAAEAPRPATAGPVGRRAKRHVFRDVPNF